MLCLLFVLFAATRLPFFRPAPRLAGFHTYIYIYIYIYIPTCIEREIITYVTVYVYKSMYIYSALSRVQWCIYTTTDVCVHIWYYGVFRTP